MACHVEMNRKVENRKIMRAWIGLHQPPPAVHCSQIPSLAWSTYLRDYALIGWYQDARHPEPASELSALAPPMPLLRQIDLVWSMSLPGFPCSSAFRDARPQALASE